MVPNCKQKKNMGRKKLLELLSHPQSISPASQRFPVARSFAPAPLSCALFLTVFDLRTVFLAALRRTTCRCTSQTGALSFCTSGSEPSRERDHPPDQAQGESDFVCRRGTHGRWLQSRRLHCSGRVTRHRPARARAPRRKNRSRK